MFTSKYLTHVSNTNYKISQFVFRSQWLVYYLNNLNLITYFVDLSGSCCECEHEFPDIWSYCDHVGVTHRRVVPFIINDNKYRHSLIRNIKKGGGGTSLVSGDFSVAFRDGGGGCVLFLTLG